MNRTNLILVIAVVAATLGGWAGMNRPADEPAWPAHVAGLAYSPLDPARDAGRPYRSESEIETDLALVAERSRSIRTYSIDGPLADVPALAARHGLGVTLGVWLDDDPATDAREIERLDDVVAANDNVERVIVGNEAILREDWRAPELARLLERLRAELPVPVGTAEPWHVWLRHPELAEHVDFIAVHLLPFWEGIGVDDAVDHVDARMRELAAAYPDKPIVIAEVGWPSWGRARGAATASPPSAETFLRRFLEHAENRGYDYYLREAFDQPWKRADEGQVGAHWGLYDASRRPKYDFAGPAVPIQGWPRLATAAALFACAAFALLVTDARTLHAQGRVLLAGTAALLGSGTILSLHRYLLEPYWTASGVLSAGVLLLGLLGVVALVLVEAHEWAEARWCRRVRRHGEITPAPRHAPRPKISIHVAAYEEPPGMLVETLASLAALDYDDYEVIVVDNNTRDERLWRPLEAFCNAHENFRFFHVAPLEGHKAGALNFALARTAPDAELVAVVDSDYVVDASWLADLAPAFADESVAIVQAPQAYRDQASGAFKSLCDAEYHGFFEIGMGTRSAHNAIIQHGTMTIVRRRVLDQVGGWAEWTITEDAELGLRVLEHGYRALYTRRPYGRGLTPDNFLDYKNQRFRWAFGAVQILRAHAGRLTGRVPSALTRRQRFHFVAGWLGWLADGGNLVFNVVAVAWSACMIAAPERFYAPVAPFTVFVLALFGFKLVKQAALYRTKVGATPAETLGALAAGLALVFTVGQAVLAGLIRRTAPFRRTPKLARHHNVAGAVAAARGETGLAAALLASAAGVAATAPWSGLDRTLWCVLLTVFAVPHLAALGVALVSVRPSAQPDARPIGEAAPDLRRG